MEISIYGAMALENIVKRQAADAGLMRKSLDVQKDMATQLIQGIAQGSVDTSADGGKQVNLVL